MATPTIKSTEQQLLEQIAGILAEQTDTLVLLVNQSTKEILQQMATNQDAVQAAFTASEANFGTIKTALTSIASGVAALDAQIQMLAQQVALGSSTLSAADQSSLNQLVSDSAILASQAQGISTAPPSTSAPASGTSSSQSTTTTPAPATGGPAGS
jgi:chromosome segregation ATPase